jgi:hypothetical protein
MNKTVYLRDEEVPIWERARELSGDKLSPVIIGALRRYIAEREAEDKSFERIVVQFHDVRDHSLPKAKAFYGKWIIGPGEDYSNEEFDEEGFRRCFAVAVTAKGAAVVWCWTAHALSDDKQFERFNTYPDLITAVSDGEVNAAVREAVERRGVPVEELDI